MLFMLREQVGVLTNDIKHALKVASRIRVIVCSSLSGVKVIMCFLLKKLYSSLQLSISLPTTRSRRYLLYFTPFGEQHINHVLQT